MLRRRKQFRLLPKIVQAFEEEWNARNGLVKISVTYPKKFEGSVEDFEKSLSAKLGKKVVMSKTPSDSLIGGLRLHMGDTLIDASLEGQVIFGRGDAERQYAAWFQYRFYLTEELLGVKSICFKI